MASKNSNVTGSIHKASANNSSNEHSYLHGAAVIDENGVETPITEHMIQMACYKLICDWESSLKSNR